MQGKKSRPRKGRPWSRLKQYRLLILFAEFVLKANPDFLKGEDTETDFNFGTAQSGCWSRRAQPTFVGLGYAALDATGRGCVGR